MINNLRFKEIIDLLYKRHGIVTGEQLCTAIGVSARTIRSDIKELNSILELNGAIILSEKGKGYLLEVTNKDEFGIFINNYNKKSNDINYSSEGRIKYIVNKLLLNEIRGIYGVTQQELCDDLYISLSSLKNDIKILKDNLEKVNLYIKKNGNKGIMISGAEEDLREYINENLSTNKLFKEKINSTCNEELIVQRNVNLKKIIIYNISRFKLKLTDMGLETIFAKVFIILLRRNNKLNYTNTEIEALKREPKIEIAKSIITDIEKALEIEIEEDEIYYLTKHISANNLIASNNESMILDYDINEVSKNLVEKILIAYKDTFGNNLIFDNIFKNFLRAHIKAAINRVRYGIKIENNMLNTIKNTYPVAFEIAVLANEVIEMEEGITLSEEDIGFIALHFAAAIERNKEGKKTIKKAIIVCTTGIATSLLLKIKINNYFKDKLLIMDTISLYELNKDILNNMDIIITTVPLEIKSEKIIYIKNLLDKEEIKLIEDKIEGKRNNNILENIFDEKLFKIDAEAKNGQEFLKSITEYLIANKYITKAVQKELFNREKIASTEIGNLVAIPHTMHSDIKKSFILVAIFNNPIIWKKDKTQLVLLIAISKEDQHKWKEGLEQIYKNIIDLESVSRLIKCRDLKEFIKLIYS